MRIQQSTDAEAERIDFIEVARLATALVVRRPGDVADPSLSWR